MRYAKGRKDETRRRITEVAAERFRADGIASAGIAGLMAEAGLTNGAFYAHFESKEHLVREALPGALDAMGERRAETIAEGGLEAWLRRYLSLRHRNAPAQGCPAAAVLSELARHPTETRAPFMAGIEEAFDDIAAALPLGTPEARRRTAIAIYGLLVGGLQLARAATGEAEAEAILDAALTGAVSLAGLPQN